MIQDTEIYYYLLSFIPGMMAYFNKTRSSTLKEDFSVDIDMLPSIWARFGLHVDASTVQKDTDFFRFLTYNLRENDVFSVKSRNQLLRVIGRIFFLCSLPSTYHPDDLILFLDRYLLCEMQSTDESILVSWTTEEQQGICEFFLEVHETIKQHLDPDDWLNEFDALLNFDAMHQKLRTTTDDEVSKSFLRESRQQIGAYPWVTDLELYFILCLGSFSSVGEKCCRYPDKIPHCAHSRTLQLPIEMTNLFSTDASVFDLSELNVQVSPTELNHKLNRRWTQNDVQRRFEMISILSETHWKQKWNDSVPFSCRLLEKCLEKERLRILSLSHQQKEEILYSLILRLNHFGSSR